LRDPSDHATLPQPVATGAATARARLPRCSRYCGYAGDRARVAVLVVLLNLLAPATDTCASRRDSARRLHVNSLLLMSGVAFGVIVGACPPPG